MSKWVEIHVTIHKTFAVEIEDGETVDDAINYALGECGGYGTDVKNCRVAKNAQDSERIQQTADETIPI